MPLLPLRLRLVSRPRLLIGLLATAAVLLAFGLFPSDARAADAPTETLELHPGDNFVGWVAEPIAVADIFEQISAATLIYTWNADSRTYRYAIRDIGGTLERLDPGMSARIRIEGRKTVKWERPLTPAKGMVTLYSGVNWVAWNGRDEWPLDQVARGIGTSLVSIEVEERGIVYQPSGNIAEEIMPLTGESTLRRGDALRVTVSRDLRWLQPTGMMPRIVFVGDPPQSLQEKITSDARRVVDFFAEEFAVESDFSEVTLLFYHSIDAAVEYLESGSEIYWRNPPGWLRGILTEGSQATAWSWGFYMSTCAWQTPEPQPCHHKAVETLTHEWFHILQDHLAAREAYLVSPQWMTEGTAMWVEWLLPSDWRAVSYERDHKWKVDQAARTSVNLQSVEERNGQWQHQMGPLAIERLVELSNEDAALEFYRQMHPQISGAERLWVQNPPWHEAFVAAFGISAGSFYDEFAAWRETLPAPAQRYDYYQDDVNLSGTLRNPDRSPAVRFILFAAPLRGEFVADDAQRVAIVDDAGAFSIGVTPETTQRVWFVRDGCTLWLTDDGLTTKEPEANQYRDLDTRDLPDLNLTLPERACENELRATVLPLRGDDRWMQILLYTEDGNQWFHTARDSSFTDVVFAPEPGKYRVRLYLDGCVLWYHEKGLVGSMNSGQLLTLGEEPVSITFRIPDTRCVRQISGRVTGNDGNGIEGIQLVASHDDSIAFNDLTTEADGTFVITVPDSRDYSLYFQWEDCYVMYTESGGTAIWEDRTPITVADADVTGIEFVVPDDPASLCE